MILQKLTAYYETLLEQDKISPSGWDDHFKVSFGLMLGEDGELVQLLTLKDQETRGKKTVEVPRIMKVPAHVKRSSGVAANFLCDGSAYMLGADGKGKPARAKECFAANRELHHRLLAGVNSPAARAILGFFDRWDPDAAATHPLLAADWKELTGAANLIFYYQTPEMFLPQPVTEDPAVCAAWQQHYSGGSDTAQTGQCLVTGQVAPIATLHPAIKGVRGAQSMGASLVSFNAPAFESHGHTQGGNAPVSEYAAFAYTTALNTLLADRDACRTIGDTTVVCWAESGQPAYQQVGMGALFDDEERFSEKDLHEVLAKLASGQHLDWNGFALDPDEHFYVLGLAPNAARLSVRFFLQDSFGSFMRNLEQHYRDIAIVHSYDKFETLPLWKLLGETVNQNARSKDPQPQLAGDMLRAVLLGQPYPATLLNGAQLRIRAERSVTRGRAAIIKGYYARLLRLGRSADTYPKEDVLQMERNPHCTDLPYTLGRLFSVCEQIQEAANPGINATIKDKYFNSASCTPASIFPLLGNLAQKHLRVIRRTKPGLAVTLEKQLGELAVLVGDHYPARLTLPEQGSFQLGYYFETQARYQKKEP